MIGTLKESIKVDVNFVTGCLIIFFYSCFVRHVVALVIMILNS